MSAQEIKIEFLNHASVMINYKDVKIISDPWFEGTCFREGWGLRFTNEEAWPRAAEATHMWVSHFHTDHFHPPTLRKIAQLNPDIQVLANDSANFQMSQAMRRMGFTNIIAFNERTPLKIAADVTVTRVPATGIDNMLFIKMGETQVLNYNDCNLPARAIKKIKSKMGNVDILLNNFNHAGTLIVHPLPPVETIQNNYKHDAVKVLNLFDAKFLIPFASHHYYRTEELAQQNASLLESSDLKQLDPRVCVLEVGESVVYERGQVTPGDKSKNVSVTPRTTHHRSADVSEQEMVAKSVNFMKALAQHYFYFTWILPSLYFYCKNLNKTYQLSFRHGISAVETVKTQNVQFTSHSEAIAQWLTDLYGTDSFVVGGHLKIQSSNLFSLKLLILLAMLKENGLSFLSVFKMVFSKKGWSFFWNRREEIQAILLNIRLKAGESRL